MKRLFRKFAPLVGFAVLWIGVALLVFRVVLPSGAVLMSTDDNLGILAAQKRAIENSAIHPWQSDYLWGFAYASTIRPGLLLLKAVPVEWFVNWFHALCLAGGAWWLALYLRGKGARWAAAAFGGMVAFWTGTNLTLTYAGHIGKYGVLFFLGLATWCLGKWSATRRGGWAMAAGGAAGAMFLEQADVALFCSLGLLPVALAEWRVAWGGTWKGLWTWGQDGVRRWGTLALALLAAGLVAGGATLATLGSGVAESSEAMGKAEKWNFLTQWSQPPDESLDFVAPGWTGWKTGDEDGPYRGRTGQGTGFRNFKMESVYVGALSVVFALAGLGALKKGRRNRAVAAAWWAAALAALVLSFGRYAPAYRVLAALPGFSEIRNPNKFLHVAQVAWGVLAGLGLEALLRGVQTTPKSKVQSPKSRNWLAWGCAVAAVLAGVAWLSVLADGGSGAMRWMAQGWSLAEGGAIEHCRAFALGWLSLSLAIAAGMAWATRRQGCRWKQWQGWVAVAWTAAEAAFVLGPHYIQSMPRGTIAENELTRRLESELGANRLAWLPMDQPGLYNYWQTFLFPYRGIAAINVTQLPRPPADYAAFWNAVRDPVRQWELTGVSHVLAHAETAAALVRNPAWAGKLEPIWAYRPREDGAGGFATDTFDSAAPSRGAEFVLRMTQRPPRVALVKKWRSVGDAEALSVLSDPQWHPFDEVLVPQESALGAGGEPGYTPVESFETFKSGRIAFRATTDGPAVARVAERWSPGWRATVNGQSSPALRCDSMFLGAWLPAAGDWLVELEYAPGAAPVKAQAAGLLLAVAGMFSTLLPRRPKEASPA